MVYEMVQFTRVNSRARHHFQLKNVPTRIISSSGRLAEKLRKRFPYGVYFPKKKYVAKSGPANPEKSDMVAIGVGNMLMEVKM